MGGFGSGRYGGRSTVEGPRCKVQAGSGGAADASAFGAGQDPRDGAPRPHLGAGPSLVVTGKAPRSLAGRSQVRNGLAPGGSRIRTLGPALGTHRSEPSAASCRLGDPSPSLRQNGMLVMPTALLPPWNAIGVAV